jgi:DNA polymerase V
VDKAEGRTILAIDLKSFYASVECVDRGVDPFTTPLVVADLSRGKGTIILAVSPYLKTLGIPSRLRLYDLPEIKGMIYATPRMEHYIVRSLEVIKVYLKYVAEEDMHIYSVDEAFLDITHYLKAAGCTKKEYAKKIIDDVYKTTGLTVTAGIGPNLFMAKVAMDVEAKKRKDFMASWEMKDVPAKLWPLTPLSKMWGIGERMEKRLNALGMYTVGDIAVSDKWYLHNKFGQIGEENLGACQRNRQRPHSGKIHS